MVRARVGIRVRVKKNIKLIQSIFQIKISPHIPTLEPAIFFGRSPCDNGKDDDDIYMCVCVCMCVCMGVLCGCVCVGVRKINVKYLC